MYDCAKDMVAFHDDEVTLPRAEQTAMRDRRNSNRDRLKKGLAKGEKPSFDEAVVQGSYAMKTMLQHAAFDYDIDDGIYFAEGVLVGDRGGEMTALQARNLVRDAVDDGSFAQPPAVHSNCVRIIYQKGYHVDLPVYRKLTSYGESFYELAASGGWKRSDARNVTKWFKAERERSADGAQMRRIVRLIKKFAKSRESWSGRILSGFGITALVVENQKLYSREDESLYETMKAVRDRLDLRLEIKHPVTPDEAVTNGPDDANARKLREKLTEALGSLKPLFETDCTRNDALACWDKVFNTTFFSARGEVKTDRAAVGALTSAAIIGSHDEASAAILSSGGSRHA